MRGGGDGTQGALVAMDPTSGALRALVGGRRVERRGFDRALRAHRQPGSAFKPFVYAAALQHGFTSATMVDDEPVDVAVGRNTWTPANYDGAYAGRITVQDALARSSNAATVRISRDVGLARIVSLAHAQGISSDLPLVPALALGAAAVTPIELTTAYAPFGNGGVRVVPYAVERVEDVFGRVLWQHPVADSPQVLPVEDAFLVTSLLRGVVDDGTARSVRAAGIRGPVAGKTGTTNDGTDVWFVGYTPTLVASVWFGADEPTSMGSGATGGRLAAPVWARFIRDGWHSPEQDSAWRVPTGVESRQIDQASGKLATAWCGESRRSWFRTGTAPTESCVGDERIAMRDVDARAHDMAADVRQLLDLPEPPHRMPRVPATARPRTSPNVNVHANGRDFGASVNAVLGALAHSDGARAISHRIMTELRRASAERDRVQRRLARDMQQQAAHE